MTALPSTPAPSAPRTPGEWSLAVRRQAGVAHLGQLGLRGVPLDELLGEAMRQVAAILGVEHVALFEVAPDRSVVQGRAAFHDGQELGAEVMALLRLPMGRGSMPGFTAEQAGPVVASDLLADPRFHARAPEMGVPARAAVAAPIAFADQVWGVLAAYDDAVRAWTDDEVQFLLAVGSTLGLAIHRSQIEQELRDTAVWLEDARREAELAHHRLELLAEAGMRLSATLDPGVVLDELASFCAGRLASVALVASVDDDGVAHDAAVAAEPTDLLLRLLRVRQARGDHPGFDVLWSEQVAASSGRSSTWVDVTDAQLRARASSPEHLDALRALGVCSVAVVPLIARERVVGVLTVLSMDPGLRYEGDAVTLLEELAVRAALAVDNARLFDARHRVARSLQSALLPPALPEVDGLGLAAHYRVADTDVEIGGDFYDVIAVAEGVWGVVIGDVCGRGPDAAALTGLMRHSVRTAVVRERHPSRVLSQTNTAVLSQVDDARFCTAAYLRVQVGRRPGDPVRVTASSAGHPRPVVVRAHGGTEVLDCGGLLLGVVADPGLRDVEVALEPGDAIVLYTDGVTEARSGSDLFGEDRLLATLDDLAGGTAAEIAAGVDRAVRDFQDDTADDLAVVVVTNRDGLGERPSA